jgi:hypothetical protein
MAIKNSSNIITHKRALAMFLAALMVATIFGIMGATAGTPHGVANSWYAQGAVVALSKSTSSMATSVSHAGRSGVQEQSDMKFLYTLSNTSESKRACQLPVH